MDFQAFRADRQTIYAVVRALEIISEASCRLPDDDVIQRHPEIDWPAFAAAGNIYRHEYEAVDEALIWHTIQHGLAALQNAADDEFRRLQADPGTATQSNSPPPCYTLPTCPK
uniref:DUF86 domain-containing protein n=1 Tax=Solibacter usitatus (strain Ellin6076) TaxID=234267 RepID=Q01YL9_SOLUE